MGYPTSVFSPAARSNGQTIDASHVTDLQVEVTALETALTGTITHGLSVTGNSTLTGLQAGASTLTSLSVSGGSTLATLQAAASTFSVRPVMPPPDAVRVELGSTVTIGSSALSTLFFKAQDYLTNSSIHSTATNANRLTPQSTGIYRFSAQVYVSSNSTGERSLQILDSTGTQIASASHSSGAGPIELQVVGTKRFDALGGYGSLQLTVTGSPSTLSLGAAGVGGFTWFAMEKL